MLFYSTNTNQLSFYKYLFATHQLLNACFQMKEMLEFLLFN